MSESEAARSVAESLAQEIDKQFLDRPHGMPPDVAQEIGETPTETQQVFSIAVFYTASLALPNLFPEDQAARLRSLAGDAFADLAGIERKYFASELAAYSRALDAVPMTLTCPLGGIVDRLWCKLTGTGDEFDREPRVERVSPRVMLWLIMILGEYGAVWRTLKDTYRIVTPS